jgi:hypothetical protein
MVPPSKDGVGTRAIPMPARLKEKVLWETSLVESLTAALFAPTEAGRKRMENLALSPGAILLGGASGKEKQEASLPDMLVEILRADFPEFFSTKNRSVGTETGAFPKLKLPSEAIADPPAISRLISGDAADSFFSLIRLESGFLQPWIDAKRQRPRNTVEIADTEIPGFLKVAFLLPSWLAA